MEQEIKPTLNTNRNKQEGLTRPYKIGEHDPYFNAPIYL